MQSGHAERLDWALLRWRYISLTRQPVQAVADALGLSDRTLRHRLAHGLEVLAQTLRLAEVEAARSLAATWSAAVNERVVVSERSAPRGVDELLDELQALIGDRRGTIHISTAQLEAVARYPAAELVAYRLGRIAEWCQPRYRLDSRFVELSLLVDLGEESQSGRWQAREERFADLRAALAAVGEAAVVLLGPPGSGKSTLLRRLELDLSHDALGPGAPDEAGARAPLTFLISLNQYRAPAPGAPLPAPADWLAERWASRFPKLPPLPELARERPVVYLLDGLNEMPHRSPEEYRSRILLWRQFLLEWVTPGSGHRAVIACRSLDYSAPLSTPALRVPQVQVERLSDEKVEAFLRRYSPANAAELWAALRGSALLDAVRSPFFLRLVVEEAADTGADAGLGAAVLPDGLAALFTGLVRRALVREVARDNPRFAPGRLISAWDYERLARGEGWRGSHALPEGGALIPALAGLAYGMQTEALAGESSQARTGYADALGLLPAEEAEDIVRAGVALGVLDVDPMADELQFSHQLLQEYFAGRALAVAPDPERVGVEWRGAKITPGVRELIETLPTAEPLPALPSTGWEDTTLMAAAMSKQPERFLRALIPHNLALAGKAANLPALRSQLSATVLDELRWALVARSRDPEADLRARVEAGLMLGELGDPRFERREGPHGAFRRPPLSEIMGGRYPLGEDEPNWQTLDVRWNNDHLPRHEVELAPFLIAHFPVTNAEWRCFMEAGGYADERWWGADGGREWWRGEGTDESPRQSARRGRYRVREDPRILETWLASGQIDDEEYERWQRRLAMSDDQLEAHLAELYPGGRLVEPRYWRDERFNAASQPVVGVCWYEARAYASWLGAQTGQAFRLPTEVEFEAAARGGQGRRYAYGDAFDAAKGNTLETRVKRTTPVGVFVEGDTPEGASDMAGNAAQWTNSVGVEDVDDLGYKYPYDAGDGRKPLYAPHAASRVVRGVAWGSYQIYAPAACRYWYAPDYQVNLIGFRLVVSTPTS